MEEPENKEVNRKKVAILGGGCGAMAAALHLTSTEELRSQYQVTVYQQGWRLGGKGATGRDPRPEFGSRVYEHGLHMILGWYHNAFKMFQDVYEEWDKTPDNPFQTWRDAFEPQRMYTLQQNVEGKNGEQEWITRNMKLPPLPGTPGQGLTVIEVTQFLERLVKWLDRIFRDESGFGPHRDVGMGEALVVDSKWEGIYKDVVSQIPIDERPRDEAHDYLKPVLAGAIRLRDSQKWVGKDDREMMGVSVSEKEKSDVLGMMVHYLGGFQNWLNVQEIKNQRSLSSTLKWYWQLLDLMGAIAKGMVREVIPNGVASINNESFHEWVGRHGASESTQWSAPVRAIYDLAFAFEGGVASETDPSTAKFEAGTALMVYLRLALGYKDAPMFRMRAGMGDTIFAPIYQVLKARGVDFQFFKRVKNLSLSGDQQEIDAIEFEVQAVVSKGPAAYEPLCDLEFADGKVLPVWPEQPDWSQIENGPALGGALGAANTTFESAWCHEAASDEKLINGVDFDTVVLGISIAGVKLITPELSAASPKWKQMVDSLVTVQTHALQLWLKPTLEELGWKHGDTIQATYAEPLDTWAVMTDVLKRETWGMNGAKEVPKSLHYFCGALPGPAEPPLEDPDYPQDTRDAVKAHSRSWLDLHIGHLWPKAVTDDGMFKQELLVDPQEPSAGLTPFDKQYWRANVDPSERYVNSFPGTSVFRLKSDHSGFANLFLAGDWTVSSVNGGCVEAAVESGMAASRGICGIPAEIPNYPEGKI